MANLWGYSSVTKESLKPGVPALAGRAPVILSAWKTFQLVVVFACARRLKAGLHTLARTLLNHPFPREQARDYRFQNAIGQSPGTMRSHTIKRHAARLWPARETFESKIVCFRPGEVFNWRLEDLGNLPFRGPPAPGIENLGQEWKDHDFSRQGLHGRKACQNPGFGGRDHQFFAQFPQGRVKQRLVAFIAHSAGEGHLSTMDAGGAAADQQ